MKIHTRKCLKFAIGLTHNVGIHQVRILVFDNFNKYYIWAQLVAGTLQEKKMEERHPVANMELSAFRCLAKGLQA